MGGPQPIMTTHHDLARFENVVKDYPRGLLGRSRRRVIDGVTLRVGPGEVVGLLGPNRSGKTTLAKLLMSLSRPTSGRVERLGRPVSDRRTLARVGYVHEGHAFPPHLTARDVLFFYGAASRVSGPLLRQRVPTLLETFGLDQRAAEPIARFSKGMLQRLALAQALVNEPDLLVLDEPSEGLDLGARRQLSDLLRRRRDDGRSALVIMHSVPEIEQLCDRVIVLVAGKITHDGPTDGLRLHDRQSIGPALSRLYRKALT